MATMRFGLICAALAALCPCATGIAKEAIAHVQCEVCEIGMQEVRAHVKNKTLTLEDEIADVVENMCTIKKEEGRWLTRLDIVREDSDAQLTVVKKPDVGECRNECLVVTRACQAALKGREEDLVELLKDKEGVKGMRTKMCDKLCKKKVPKLKSWTDEEFKARDAKEVETEDMIAKMKAETGMGMKMYKREDLMGMSEGDMETMAAREAFASERQASRMADMEL
eukprot:gnl/TRDRNA2_/TRDRNA2_184062_c0_seq1.p1 gnl/TRDRNA2_/TRDRNA2_184062_c0~~gnl/TRDRNA2_/TRDRNA2_184062_c0_seq1.p1  ORF type:complete len:225 (+),score=67.17 gnl/TRDRNA2_/TRDRNA2_184062_c0_seq1:58-732(+)